MPWINSFPSACLPSIPPSLPPSPVALDLALFSLGYLSPEKILSTRPSRAIYVVIRVLRTLQTHPQRKAEMYEYRVCINFKLDVHTAVLRVSALKHFTLTQQLNKSLIKLRGIFFASRGKKRKCFRIKTSQQEHQKHQKSPRIPA